MLCDTRKDCACLKTVVNLELQQFVGLGHLCTLEYGTHTHIKLHEVIESTLRTHWVSLVVGSLVLLLDALKTVELRLDCLILDFLEQQADLAQLMSLGKKLCTAETCPLECVKVEHATQFLAAERQERLEHDREVCHKLQREIEDCCHTAHISLRELPGLGLGKVTVTDACKLHSLFLCIAELVLVEQMLNLALYIHKLGNDSLVVVGELTAGRNLAVEIFLCKHQCAVHKVTVNGNKLVVVACLEVFPCKVVVLCLGCICCEHIAQHILLSGEVNKILVEPYSPVA